MIYTRFVPFQTDPEAVVATEKHVRAHLSSVASEDDDEARYADEVVIDLLPEADGMVVRGTLNRAPAAPYLRDDWDPEQDVAANPLSVPSILEGS